MSVSLALRYRSVTWVLQRLGKSFQSQKALRLQVLPDGRSTDPFAHVLLVLP